jgi:homoserine dehydrogenase
MAIPSGDRDAAYDYMRPILAAGRLVVTAEKGGLANHFGELRAASDDFRLLGIRATVGGGTRMINYVREKCRDVDNVAQMHLVLNGTLTAIFSGLAPRGNAQPSSLGQEVTLAKTLGYAEPDSESAEEVIRGEAEGDIPKKVSILFNAAELSREPDAGLLDWHKLYFTLQDDEIRQAIDEAAIRRFIVSMYPEDTVPHNNDIIGGFIASHGGWRIVGGFQRIDRNSFFSPLAALTGAGNGCVVGLGPDESDGIYVNTGPGAGPAPTVNAMEDDLLVRSHTNNPYL